MWCLPRITRWSNSSSPGHTNIRLHHQLLQIIPVLHSNSKAILFLHFLHNKGRHKDQNKAIPLIPEPVCRVNTVAAFPGPPSGLIPWYICYPHVPRKWRPLPPRQILGWWVGQLQLAPEDPAESFLRYPESPKWA